MNGEAERRLEVFEISWYRITLKIKWVYTITNYKQVLDRIRRKRTLLNNLRRRSAQIIGPMLKHPRLQRDILESKVGNKK